MAQHLTLDQVILQSQIIHPDWTASTHLSYLYDEGYDAYLPRTGRLKYVQRQLRDNITSGAAPATPEDAQPKVDPDCDWDGHAEAVEEHGWCSVCQH